MFERGHGSSKKRDGSAKSGVLDGWTIIQPIEALRRGPEIEHLVQS